MTVLQRIACIGGWGVILGVGGCVALAGIAGAMTALRYLDAWDRRRHAVSGLRGPEQGKDTLPGMRAGSNKAQECTAEHDTKRARP